MESDAFLCLAEARVARSARAIRVGTLRPAIVLYDESHPLGDDIGTIHSADLSRRPDMLIIMGTSLKVHGLKKLVKDFARTIHSTVSSAPSSSKKPFKVIFVNKTAPGSEWSDIIDYHIAGETDIWCNKVIDDWKKMRPADWEVQQTLVGDDETSMTGGLKTTKSIATAAATKPRKLVRERENVAPIPSEPAPKSSAATDSKPVPPLSPSKRRQKASHYDDLESSPSKRQTTSNYHRAMPTGERRMLFSEKTNKPSASVSNNLEKSKMDISVCDLSMRDIHGAERSQMDISILELSMLDVESIVDLPPTKASRKTRAKAPEAKAKRLPVAKKATTRTRKTPRQAVLVPS